MIWGFIIGVVVNIEYPSPIFHDSTPFPIFPDSIPFLVGVRVEDLLPDTTYEVKCWVYDRDARSAISQIWDGEAWKYGWLGKYELHADDVTAFVWIPLRIYKHTTGENIYLKVKVDDDEKIVDTSQIRLTPNMGYLMGTVSLDSAFTTLGNKVVILACSLDVIKGCYWSEPNGVDEGMNLSAGQFLVPVTPGRVTELTFIDTMGNFTIGYVTTEPPWEVVANETTFVDIVRIRGMDVYPPVPQVARKSKIKVWLFNPHTRCYEIPIKLEVKLPDSIWFTPLYDTVIRLDTGEDKIVEFTWIPKIEGYHKFITRVYNITADCDVFVGKYVERMELEVVPRTVRKGGVLNITYRMPFREATVKLELYDVTGNRVVCLLKQFRSPAEYSLQFDTGELDPGAYIIYIRAVDCETGKQLVAKYPIAVTP